MTMDQSIFISGPEPKLKLIYNDVWLPSLFSRRILCFSLPSTSNHAKVVDVVKRGLDALVRGTPELGSISVIVPADQHDGKIPWRALEPYKGIELVVKNMTKSFMSFQEFQHAGYPLSVIKDEDFIPVPGPITTGAQPQAKFQLSFIEGGVLISCCILHHLTDGNGMNTIMRALGEECARAAQTDGSLPPRVLDTDRSTLLHVTGTKTDIADHPGCSYLPGIFTPGVVPNVPAPTGPPPRFTPAYFRIEHDQAVELKAWCSKDTAVSTHDAISAMLWRTSIVARFKAGKVQEDVMTTFSMPHNARKYVGLPKEWIGNCVRLIIASMPVSEILKDGSVPVMAGKLRAALNAVNPDVVAGMLQMRKDDPYGINWWPFFGDLNKEIVFITSLYHSELLGMSWGAALGDVQHFTSTNIGALGVGLQAGNFVGPRLAGGSGCDVHVGLLQEESEDFLKDELWNQYFTPLSFTSNGYI